MREATLVARSDGAARAAERSGRRESVRRETRVTPPEGARRDRVLRQHETGGQVVRVACAALARSTGREYETDFVRFITVRDGRVVRFPEFFDACVAAEVFRP